MKKIVLLLSLALSAFSTYAQEANDPEELEKKKEINEIKLSEQAHYAEVVIEMVTDDNEAVSLAHQQSLALLQTHVIEVFAKRLNMSKQDVREIWSVIDDKCQNIEIQRGDLLRVFSYMAKDALKGWMGNKKVKPLSPEDSLILFGPKEIIVEQEPIVPDTIDPGPNPEPKPEPLEVVVPELCKNMIKQGNAEALTKYLNYEKSKQTLMYGNASTMHYQSKCYMIAIEKSTLKIAAVLDKGDARRMNFMTGEMDNMENYRGGKYAVIFVQEY